MVDIRSICVYCGSADGLDAAYTSAAVELGRTLARDGITLVYGAGRTGLMGAVADGVLAAGGQVTGIIPNNLNTPRLTHAGLTRLEVVETIHIRKARMVELADAFIALPGGYGTFDELFEALTWAQIGLHNKPIGLLNTRNYYEPLLAMVRHALQEGFIYAEHGALPAASESPQELLEKLRAFTPSNGPNRWVERD